VPAAYDVLIKAEHVLDPAQGLDGPLDIALRGDQIVAVGHDLQSADAVRTIAVRGANRYVAPGLIDLHTHVAYGATTPGVGLDCCDPDVVGVGSGVTTVVDTGSVGVTNIGVFASHIIPAATTRVLCYLNVGSKALTTSRPADVLDLDEVDRPAIARCVEANPGLISGIKLRITGPFVLDQGEALIDLSKAIAVEHGVPFMAHIGNRLADPSRGLELTRHLLRVLEPGDIITHLCTPHPGGAMALDGQLLAEVAEAGAAGVVLDAALGRHNFSYEVARRQVDAGLRPHTISTDLTPGGYGEIVYSLLECMAKFLTLGYSLSDVVRMTTSEPARALHLEDTLGAIAEGYRADLTIFDVVDGRWQFLDTVGHTWTGETALVPVQTIRQGALLSPNWGPHPWGWLPPAADPVA
jgi:dihydroorotase